MRVQRIPVISKLKSPLLAAGAFALVAIGVSLAAAPIASANTVILNDQPAIGEVAKVLGARLVGKVTIDYPPDGKHFTSAKLVVTGVCPAGSLVTIYDNNAIRASGMCNDSGSYAIPIELFYGKNVLQAKATTELNQGALYSNIVTVWLDTPAECALGQFRLLPVEGIVNAVPGATLLRHVITVGGEPPYDLTWKWGDGTADTSTAKSEGQTQLSQIYAKTGVYIVQVSATDKNGAVATTQIVSVILNASMVDLPGRLLDYWPVAVAALTLMSTYLWGRHRGRRYEQEMQERRMRLALERHGEQESDVVKVSAAPGPVYVERVSHKEATLEAKPEVKPEEPPKN